jgi:hypothetical protein
MFALLLLAPAQAEFLQGIGVLGDSYSDEYQFYPPDRSTAQNWLEILARKRGLDFGAFSTSSRGEPRNQGFAYNWARTDAETEDLIQSGQHTGVAAQAARGEVGVVIIFIGGNDFIHAMARQKSGLALDYVLHRAICNLDSAVDTILRSSPKVRVMIATVPDIAELPEFAVPIRAGRLPRELAASYCEAICQYNRHIRWISITSRQVDLIDLALASQLARRPDADHIIVAGRKLDRIHPSNSPEHAFLADSRHISTLVQGMLANHVINALNARCQASVRPLSVSELLEDDTPSTALTSLGSRLPQTNGLTGP